MADASFRDLVRLAIQGDSPARNRLFEEVRSSVECLTRGYQPPRSLAESTSDLVQDVCMKLAQRLGQFRGLDDDRLDDDAVRRMFFAWIKTAVAHEMSNRFRDAAVEWRGPPGKRVPIGAAAGDSRDGYEPAGRTPTPSAIVGDGEVADLLRQTIEQLPDPLDREVVRLAHFEGVSLRQIAKRLNVSLDIVRARYHKSLKALAQTLGPMLGMRPKP